MVAAIERFVAAGLLRFRLRSRAAMARTLRLTGAAVAAFAVAQLVFPDTVPILAPLTALLVVEVTLKDILTSGVQRVASVTAGVLLAVGFSSIVGLSWWSLGVLVAIAILIGQVMRLGPHLIEVPISAMLVLAVGGAEAAATDRIAETLLGAAVGVAVNLVFPPAVRANTAAEAVHRYASELSKLLGAAATDLRDPITQAQAIRWMEDARALSRHVPAIDKALEHAENSRQLNPRALVVPDTSNTLRADLDALEHTNVAVRSMFRSILDGVRDNPTPDPSQGEDLRLVFSALLGDVAAAIQAFGDLALAEGTDHIEDNEETLAAALNTLREARDRIDDLQLMDAGVDGGWELSEPVQQTVERVLRDLDVSEQARRRNAPTVSPKVDPLEILKTAHHIWQEAQRPTRSVGHGRRHVGRDLSAEQTGTHRVVGRAAAGRTARTPRGDSALDTGRMRAATETGRLRAASHPTGRANSGPSRR